MSLYQKPPSKIIQKNTITDRLTTLADVYATVAEISESSIAPESGVDSISFLSTLKGEQQERAAIVMHSISGAFAIRQGNWKLCLASGSAGWSQPNKGSKDAPKWQLFNLADDLSETQNLYDEYPDKVEELYNLLVSYVEKGRSTPGANQANDVAEIKL